METLSSLLGAIKLDSNGWLNHLLVGLLLCFVLAKRWAFIISLLLAIAKEWLDAKYGMGTLILSNAMPDILFTILVPFINLWRL